MKDGDVGHGPAAESPTFEAVAELAGRQLKGGTYGEGGAGRRTVNLHRTGWLGIRWGSSASCRVKAQQDLKQVTRVMNNSEKTGYKKSPRRVYGPEFEPETAAAAVEMTV